MEERLLLTISGHYTLRMDHSDTDSLKSIQDALGTVERMLKGLIKSLENKLLSTERKGFKDSRVEGFEPAGCAPRTKSS